MCLGSTRGTVEPRPNQAGPELGLMVGKKKILLGELGLT